MTHPRQDFRKKANLTLKWYFDACALDFDPDQSVKDITNKTAIAYISHLSLGEAYGNCLRKNFDKTGEDANEAIFIFTNFVRRLKGFVNIIGNDDIDDIFSELRDTFRLSITDAMHLATAIKNECNVFRTADPDFNVDRKKINDYVKKRNGREFAISMMD